MAAPEIDWAEANQAISDEFYGREYDAVEELLVERLSYADAKAKLAAIEEIARTMSLLDNPYTRAVSNDILQVLYPTRKPQ